MIDATRSGTVTYNYYQTTETPSGAKDVSKKPDAAPGVGTGNAGTDNVSTGDIFARDGETATLAMLPSGKTFDLYAVPAEERQAVAEDRSVLNDPKWASIQPEDRDALYRSFVELNRLQSKAASDTRTVQSNAAQTSALDAASELQKAAKTALIGSIVMGTVGFAGSGFSLVSAGKQIKEVTGNVKSEINNVVADQTAEMTKKVETDPTVTVIKDQVTTAEKQFGALKDVAAGTKTLDEVRSELGEDLYQTLKPLEDNVDSLAAEAKKNMTQVGEQMTKLRGQLNEARSTATARYQADNPEFQRNLLAKQANDSATTVGTLKAQRNLQIGQTTSQLGQSVGGSMQAVSKMQEAEAQETTATSTIQKTAADEAKETKDKIDKGVQDLNDFYKQMMEAQQMLFAASTGKA